MVRVRVPASTANLGSGFDCMGIALNLYTEACFEEIDSGLEIIINDDSRKFLPADERNYVYQAMLRVFDKAGMYPKGIRITSHTDIPMTRGLGSSSASLALGICGANCMIGSPFSKDEMLSIAYDIEGHPDNVTPAFMGGYTVSVFDNNKLMYTKTDIPDNITFAAFVPDFYLSTKKARGVLPKFVPHKNAVFNVSHAAFMASAIAKGDFTSLAVGSKDRLHQKFRFGMIKSAEYIIRNAKRNGAMCGYLSGAGPTIIAVLNSNEAEFKNAMSDILKNNLKDWKLKMLKADNDGVICENI